MSQQKLNDDVGDTSDREVKDSVLNSKKDVTETEDDSVLETEIEEESTFLERWENSRFWLIKGSFYFLRTVWVIVMAIGTFILWLISLLFV